MSSTTPVNSVTLAGRLTRDPQLRYLPNGRPVCDMRLAVNGSGDAVTFIDVATFGKPAEACAQYLSKGREVAVTGSLVYRQWQAPDGWQRSKHSVIGRVQFGPQRRRTGAAA
jgi:single-strand DNA-binding protein